MKTRSQPNKQPVYESKPAGKPEKLPWTPPVLAPGGLLMNTRSGSSRTATSPIREMEGGLTGDSGDGLSGMEGTYFLGTRMPCEKLNHQGRSHRERSNLSNRKRKSHRSYSWLRQPLHKNGNPSRECFVLRNQAERVVQKETEKMKRRLGYASRRVQRAPSGGGGAFCL
jgi:hypothetical protein